MLNTKFSEKIFGSKKDEAREICDSYRTAFPQVFFFFLDNEGKEATMGRTLVWYGKNEEYIQNFDGETS
jgi:hypothetical protein